jgi:hypothetical protein
VHIQKTGGVNVTEETARIQSAGGFVEFGRVNGKLFRLGLAMELTIR